MPDMPSMPIYMSPCEVAKWNIQPAGSKTGIYRVNRGGAYNDFGKHLRSAYRSATNPLDHDQNLGFRVARNDETGSGIIETKYDTKIASITIPKNPKILIPYFSYSWKTVISFSSHGGTRYGDSVSDLGKKVQNSYLGLPFEFYYDGGRNLESRID